MTAADIEYEVKVFLYDLDNRAKEHWFKADEKWEVVIATARGKTEIEKNYFPVVSLEGSLPMIKAIAEQVNNGMNPFKELTVPVIKGDDPVWLLAYNPVRVDISRGLIRLLRAL